MNQAVQTEVVSQAADTVIQFPVTVKTPVSKEVVAKVAKEVIPDIRTRYSFGKVWTAAVIAGTVTNKNQDKLIAHAVEIKAGRKYDLSKLKFATLLAKVQAKLATEAA